MQIEQAELNPPIISCEVDCIARRLPFVLLHMERQPTIIVKGGYNEAQQVWIDTSSHKEASLFQRTPTFTGTQTQAGRQLDLDRDQD